MIPKKFDTSGAILPRNGKNDYPAVKLKQALAKWLMQLIHAVNASTN